MKSGGRRGFRDDGNALEHRAVGKKQVAAAGAGRTPHDARHLASVMRREDGEGRVSCRVGQGWCGGCQQDGEKGRRSGHSADPDDPVLPAEPDDRDLAATEADLAILARLDGLMAERAHYLDPELSLSRRSRRLGLPLKQLSGAINRAKGDNVSRYINKARIAAAQRLLADGKTVTEAMFAAGFNTRSNFDREFLRVTGRTPSAWRTAAQVTGQVG